MLPSLPPQLGPVLCSLPSWFLLLSSSSWLIYGFFPLASWSLGAVVGRGECCKNNSGPFPASSYCHFKGSCRISWGFKKNHAFSLLYGPVFIPFRTLGHQGRKKENTHTDTLIQKQLQIALNCSFFFPFLHSPTSRGFGGGTRTPKQPCCLA